MKFLSLFFVALFVSLSLSAQTTMEEYLYVTKGYQVQIESGLDMKKGYQLVDIDQATIGERKVELKLLNKVVGTTKKKAAYMIIYTREGAKPEYICVPRMDSDKEVIQKYSSQLFNGEGDHSQRLQIIALTLSTLIDWK